MKQLVLLCLLCVGTIIYAQNSFNAEGELAKSVNVPNSPEAQAFTNYGNNSANLNTGTPIISIPLYTYKGIEMDLPISLTYDTNARKVEDIASGMGMGWNLNLGGRVSRIANGLPDECITYQGIYQSLVYPIETAQGFRDDYMDYKDQYNPGGGYGTFGSQTEAEDYLKFLNRIQTSGYDLEPDHFSIAAPGLSDRAMRVFDETTETIKFIMESNPRLDFSFSNGVAYVTDDTGRKYTFAVTEKTRSFNGKDVHDINGLIAAPSQMEYYSSWLLTEIVSANGKDVYTFEYEENFGYWSNDPVTTTSKRIDTRPQNPGGTWQGYIADIENSYDIDQKALKRVLHNQKEIIVIDLQARDDFENDSKIASITVKSPIDPAGNAILKHFKFSHSLFGPTNWTDPKQVRLKLDKIEIAGKGYSGAGHNYEMQYNFDYHQPEQMPARDSKAQDEYGFFNGVTGNSDLYPEWELPDGHVLSGADREFNLNSAKVGILTRIDYPTEGYTEYVYESHLPENESPNGLRVASISNYSDAGVIATRKEFEYVESYINLLVKPVLTYDTDEQLVNGDPVVEKYHRLAKASISEVPYISYRKVREKMVNPNNPLTDYGYTEHLFYNANGGMTNKSTSPFTPSYAGNIESAMLEKQTVIDATGQTLSTSDNDYTAFVADTYNGFAIEDEPLNGIYYIRINNSNPTAVQLELESDPNQCAGCYPPSYARLKPFKPYTIPSYLKESVQTSTQVLDGNNITATTTSTWNDTDISNLLRQTVTTTSDTDETLVTLYKYPEDFDNQGDAKIDALVTANRIAAPVQTETYERTDDNGTITDELLGKQKTLFDFFADGNGGNLTLPKSIQVAQWDNNLETRVIFDEYDTHGNTVQMKKANDVPTVYLWGYDNRLPVAKIENATYLQVGALVNLTTLGASTDSATIAATIQTLRNSLPESMVTTFEYNHQMMVSTITDPRGYKSHYYYDAENRLQYATDADGNVLSNNEYNFRINN